MERMPALPAINRVIFYSLFVDSANVYKSFVLLQLIRGTILMTVSVFYLDLVRD